MTEIQKHPIAPGDEHPVTISLGGAPVTATLAGTVIASTAHPLLLQEEGHDVVYYFPREDVEFSLFSRTEHTTQCPYKGDCSYFTVTAGDTTATNAAWSYEQPKDAARDIAGYIAFDLEQVDVNVMD